MIITVGLVCTSCTSKRRPLGNVYAVGFTRLASASGRAIEALIHGAWTIGPFGTRPLKLSLMPPRSPGGFAFVGSAVVGLSIPTMAGFARYWRAAALTSSTVILRYNASAVFGSVSPGNT